MKISSTTIRRLKGVARTLGVYFVAREVYRAFSPMVRARVRADRALFSTIVSPGDLVFDIGVNLGQKSRCFLALGARVVAVEPNPNCLAHLRRSFAGNLGYTLVPAAIGAATGRARLNFAGTDPSASLRDDWTLRGGTVESVDVDVVTLDSLVEAHGTPDYVKMDVEGFEPEALRGLTTPLPLLSAEYHLDRKDDLLDCLALREALGPIAVNVIAIHGGEMVLPDWVTPDDFRSLVARREIPAAGDVFIRAVPADAV